MARILIVEDQERHMKDAVTVAKEMGHSVICASNAGEAASIIRNGTVDAVVTDVYLPLDDDAPWNHSESPCGINVAMAAKKAGVPCIFCTDDNHHGAKVQWLKSLVDYGNMGLPYLVGGNGIGESKNWKIAIEYITKKGVID